MSKLKKELAPYKELEQFDEGDIVAFCTCLSSTDRVDHPTDTYDAETCAYCGYYIMERRVSAAEAVKFNKKTYKAKLKAKKKERLAFLMKEKVHGQKLH